MGTSPPISTSRTAQKLNDDACDAFGASEVFKIRANRYRRKINFLTWSGLAIPITISGVVTAQLIHPKMQEKALWVAGVLSLFQALVSGWSVVANWPENLEYSQNSSTRNFEISEQLQTLAQEAMAPNPDFEMKKLEAMTRNSAQIEQDLRRGPTKAETQYAHRAGLIHLDRTCAKCQKRPDSSNLYIWPWMRCRSCGGKK